MAYTQEDLMKGFGAPNQGIDLSKFEDFSKTLKPEQSKMEAQEFRDTGTFSKSFINQYKDFLGNQKPLENQMDKGFTETKPIEEKKIPGEGTLGETPIDPIKTMEGESQFGSEFDKQRQANLESLKKETERIKTEGEKAIEEAKKQYLLGQQKFNQNKQYIENFDQVNNLYTSVVNDLVKSMGDTGVIDENTYQQIASRYNLTLDEVKNAEKILDRAKYTEEGRKKFGITEGEQSLVDMEIARDRKIKDMQTALDRTLQNYNWQIEDIEKQVSRNLSFMEATGAWSGALRSSGFLEGIQNVKKDGETMINRLKTLAEQASQATEEDIARLQEDFNKAHTKAKEDLTEQLKQFTTNTMLALTEAQATYGMGSDKLQNLLKEIGVNLENQYYEQIERYYRIEDSINKKQLENLTYLQQLVDKENAVFDNNYNNYLANNGAILQNTSMTTIEQDLREGKINTQRAKDLKQIMLSSIQSTLGSMATLTRQDLQTIETLLNQGYTPAEIVSEMQSLEKFQQIQTISPKDRFMNVGGNLYDVVNETWVTPDTPSTTQTPSVSGMTATGDLRHLAPQFPNQAWAKNNNPAGITWNANFDKGIGTAALLREAGINYSKGTARPANEGGNYVTFDTIEDGLKAQRIIMTQTYGNSTVEQMLGKWVGTGEALNYAKQVAGNAGVSLNAKVSSLSDDQISQLQMAKIQKESPGLFNILQGAGGTTTGSETTFNMQSVPQYINYLTTGKIGTNAEEIKQIEKEFGSVENFKKQVEVYNNSPGGPREQEINQITRLKDTLGELQKETGAIKNVAGIITTALTPWGLLEKKDFLGKIQNVLDQKTLQTLIDAKGEGATFGALSNEELRMLQAAGSVLSSRAVRDKNTNAIKYFDMSEKALKNELQKMIDTYNQNIDKINQKMGKVDTPGASTQDNGRWQKSQQQ